MSALPQQTTANPLQPNYITSVPQGQAALYQGAQLGQNLNPQIAQQLSPDAAIQALYQQFAPEQATATRSLNDTLAGAGLVGGPAINAQQNLQAQLAQGLGGSIASLIQGGQNNLLNAATTQAGFDQTAGTGNQGALNSFGIQNLQDLFNANSYNATASNDANSAFAQDQIGAYNQLFDANNAINLDNLQGSYGINAQGLSGAQQLAQSNANNFPVQTGFANAFQNLGSGLGGGQSSKGSA